MARKKVIDLDASTTVGFGNNPGQIKQGQEVSGYYVGSRKVQTSMNESTLHILQTPKGNLGVWGAAQLNSKLGSVALGTMVFITYKGKVKVPKGTMKKFEVEYDDADKIEVDTPEVNFNTASEPDESTDDGYATPESDVTDDLDDAEVEEASRVAAPKAAPPKAAPPKPNTSAVTPEQRARVSALLGKK